MGMEFGELTKKIIGCAYKVYNQMGFGFLESVYENCLMIELMKSGVSAKNQEPITVWYEEQAVGQFVADVIVEDTVIVELKSVNRLLQTHEVQLVNYLIATDRSVGLLLNFGPDGVEVKRKVPRLTPSADDTTEEPVHW
jgi:GxxExxY protein